LNLNQGFDLNWLLGNSFKAKCVWGETNSMERKADRSV